MPDDLPFVVQPPADDEVAARAASVAATKWGLAPPRHLRTGMNALFLTGEDVMLRVSHTTAPPSQAAWLMGQLAERGVRVPRVVHPAPLSVGVLSVLAIERIQPAGEVDWTDVGAQIRRVHEWPVGEVRGNYPLPLCDDFPWWNTSAILGHADDLLDHDARRGLRVAIRDHGDWRSRVTSRVVCHGDVHPGNIIQSSDGPVLLDWDLACHAPAAWDHAMLLTWSPVWGGDASAYDRFASGYGQSLREDELARSLSVMRNVTATLMRLEAGRSNPAAAQEAQRRLQYWRGDTNYPAWSAQ